jgi:four helix bundle protein
MFPENEKYGLISQIQRSAVSVSSNIAEGSARVINKDQAHFYQTAYASLMELLCQLTLCVDVGYLKESDYELLRSTINKIAFKLNALRRSALNKIQR